MTVSTTEGVPVKRCIAALVLTLLAFPGAALAVPDDLRAPDQRSPRDVPSHLPATGTDVAAPDQQASTGAGSLAPASTPASAGDGFDWTDAGIGAAGAASLLGISLAGVVALRGRRQLRDSALAG
jgi:hypothetical protein